MMRGKIDGIGLGCNIAAGRGDGGREFKVILPGPDGNYDRLRTPAGATVLVPSSIEAQLNDRQKQIMVLV